MPADVELISIVEGLARLQVIAGVFNRLFLSAYSGSGLVIVCCGRLNAILPASRMR
jgi:hypothetical protein